MKYIRALTVLFAVMLMGMIMLADFGLLTAVLEGVHAIPYADTAGHFMLFGTLSLLVSFAFFTGYTRVGPALVLNSSLLLAGVMTLEELSQMFVASRRFSMLDLLANYAGIWLFGMLGEMLRKRLQSE